MPGRIPREFIDDLLVRVDIVDLIDTHLPLKKTGSNFVARCPFHVEKTPSFSVNRNKQFFHCFGCGASGNAITFLIDYCHLDFVEAVEDLAAFVNVDVPREAAVSPHTKENKQDLSLIFDVLQQVAHYFAEQLRVNSKAHKTVEYLKSRGVSGGVARDFLLGYAPEGGQVLSSRFEHKRLSDAGLLVSRENGSSYDRFRGRVIFPIRDRRGRVVGFGARVLDDSLPKYLNSPETDVFHKGREVYGLYELLEINSKPERILIVEGYMDVIALYQFGINYAVATLGTATSRNHLDLLFRFSSELVFCFDGDAAGRKAAWKAVEMAFPCLRDGRQIRIMLLEQGDDPDSLIREEGVEGFEKKLNSAKTLSDFFFTRLADSADLDNLEGRARLVEQVMPYLHKLPNGVFQEMMLARLKEMTSLEGLDVFKVKHSHSGTVPSRNRQKLSPARTAISLLLQYPKLAGTLEQQNINWSGLDVPGISLLRKIAQRIYDYPQITTAGLVEGFRGLPEERQVQLLVQTVILVPENGIIQEFCGCLDRLVAQAREDKLAELINKEKQQGLDKSERELFLSMLAARSK